MKPDAVHGATYRVGVEAGEKTGLTLIHTLVSFIVKRNMDFASDLETPDWIPV